MCASALGVDARVWVEARRAPKPRPTLVEKRLTETDEFTGPEAAKLAEVTYRQLDYWARQGWVGPSVMPTTAGRRRLYSVADLVRLAALGHLGRSRLDVATYGRAMSQLAVPERTGFVIVFALSEGSVSATDIKNLRRLGRFPGAYVVFDPSPLLDRIRGRHGEAVTSNPRRRSFSARVQAGRAA